MFLLFLLMLRLPLRSTLFPYTTLFRSDAQAVYSDLSGFKITLTPCLDGWHVDYDLTDRLSAGDRKSTRLNSSHSQISYAVFCLKKKTALSANHSSPTMHFPSKFHRS